MKDDIEKAAKSVASKITDDIGHDEALKYSQAMLNLTHALSTLAGIERAEKQ